MSLGGEKRRFFAFAFPRLPNFSSLFLQFLDMFEIRRLLALAAVLSAPLVSASLWGGEDVKILADLQPLLSEKATILARGDEGFEQGTKRWQWWATPDVAAVVNVQSEEDVVQTVRKSIYTLPFTISSTFYFL